MLFHWLNNELTLGGGFNNKSLDSICTIIFHVGTITGADPEILERRGWRGGGEGGLSATMVG